MRQIAMTAACLTVLASAAGAQNWQLSADAPEGNYLTQNLIEFADDVSEATDGAFQIDVVGNSVLLGRAELKRGVQRGIVPIGEVLISALANENALYAADAVPLLATTFEEARTLWDATRPIYEEMLAEEGLMLLFAVPWPPQGIYMENEVMDASAFDGISFRAYSPATSRFAELLGAVPTNVAAPEVAQAFSTGVIDGMLTSPATGVDSQAWDYVDYYYDVRAFIPKNMVIVNQGAFDGLDEAAQTALTEAAATAQERGWQMAQDQTQAYTDELAENGMTVSETPPGIEDMLQSIADTMRSEWLEDTGEEGQQVVDALN
ncbi:TRAP-type C4-dicarboxylate transport system substrate-binding protein [Palleronia aestuarii]|uniref:TRAP-type C4-dicarboxylate transport system substrate-binding protein n=1 Tax=Palleronia aestuarii TaxID=568105 RepID=A0A2W7NHD3_9RHOB|nr:TRAP transporter substrate-binding protein [Palleronia aestuarii]PZX19841.1 TRAP-type C4-dicarboxylate transport system substrate-binding protein [Palleronia aestuarii]